MRKQTSPHAVYLEYERGEYCQVARILWTLAGQGEPQSACRRRMFDDLKTTCVQ